MTQCSTSPPTDRKVVDVWVKTFDKPSFLMARRLIREEGLLCGGSSGTAVYAACQVTPTGVTGLSKAL